MSVASMKPLHAVLGGVVTALVALAVAVSPVIAAEEQGHHGKVGLYDLHDANGDVVCHYMQFPPYSLQSVSIGAPFVWARDKTGGVDHQKVGWRYIIKRHKTGDVGMTRVKRSKIFKAMATDSTPASFTGKQTNVASVAGTEIYVYVKVYWYKANGATVAGWAKTKVSGYTENNIDYNYWPLAYCPATYYT